jgi:hypothetical protein
LQTALVERFALLCFVLFVCFIWRMQGLTWVIVPQGSDRVCSEYARNNWWKRCQHYYCKVQPPSTPMAWRWAAIEVSHWYLSPLLFLSFMRRSGLSHLIVAGYSWGWWRS